MYFTYKLNLSHDRPQTIYLFLRLAGKYTKIPTGQKITRAEWDKEKGAPTKARKNKNLAHWLEAKAVEIRANFYTMTSQGKPTQEEVVQMIKDTLRGYTVAAVDFFEIYAQYIKEAEVKASTAHVYQTALNRLRAFQADTRYNLTLNTLNPAFDKKFAAWMQGQGVSKAYISKTFSRINVFMSYCYAQGLIETPYTCTIKGTRETSAKVDIILTPAELDQLEAAELADYQRRVADMFIFMCETSLRFSDMQLLTAHNIVQHEGRMWIETTTKKTSTAITVLLSDRAIMLIEKYKGCREDFCFPRISNQKFNNYLKSAAKAAGLNDLVVIDNSIDNVKRVPKHEAITAHTARRTFVSLKIAQGWEPSEVMASTGHKSLEEITTYFKSDNASRRLILSRAASRTDNDTPIRSLKTG